MSRVGSLPIEVSGAVKVGLKDNFVEVQGPVGCVAQRFDSSVKIIFSDNVVTVAPANDSRFARAMYGTARSIIYNMVQGVQKPFQKDLEIQGVGFKALLNGATLDLSLGYSHPVNYKIPEGINVVVKDGTMIHIEGADKYLVGKVAAEIKRFYPVEPYKGKGIRVSGEHVRRKEGKKSAK